MTDYLVQFRYGTKENYRKSNFVYKRVWMRAKDETDIYNRINSFVARNNEKSENKYDLDYIVSSSGDKFEGNLISIHCIN